MESFSVGEYAVCPGHGVGQICNIEDRKVGQDCVSYYVIKLAGNGMKVMIPVTGDGQIRKLADGEAISDVFGLLQDHDVKLDTSTWNRRYREYMEKIKTGDLIEIADVLRSLFLLKAKKSLSFGERKMLNQCMDLLVQEIALSNGDTETSISSKIEACFSVAS